VSIFTGTRVERIHSGPTVSVETTRGPVVRCRHCVVATNTPINHTVVTHTKQSGYQSYVLAFPIPAGSLPPILLWDGLCEDDGAYHYLRLARASDSAGAESPKDLLIVGGEDHKTGQGPDGDAPYRRLEDWTRARFPMAAAPTLAWSGEVMEPADGLAYIGADP